MMNDTGMDTEGRGALALKIASLIVGSGFCFVLAAAGFWGATQATDPTNVVWLNVFGSMFLLLGVANFVPTKWVDIPLAVLAIGIVVQSFFTGVIFSLGRKSIQISHSSNPEAYWIQVFLYCGVVVVLVYEIYRRVQRSREAA